jgi:hypothetical protein
VAVPYSLKDFTDFDVEVEASWKGGAENNGFGFLLGNSIGDFYDFCVSRSGGVISDRVVDSKYKSRLMEWNNDRREDLRTAESYRFALAVRGNEASYSLNGFPIGTITLDGAFSPARIGVIVYNKQSVLYNSIRIRTR